MDNTESGYAYIPTSKIQSIETQAVADGPKKLFTEFSVIGDTLNNEASTLFNVQDLEEGKLFISKHSYVDDNEGNRIPRALLVTNLGRVLLKKNPRLLKKIDGVSDEERRPKTQNEENNDDNDEAYSGKVSIIDLNDGESIAIKRFKRHSDGKRLGIGGLEIAKFAYTLSQSKLAEQVRHPMIYFASQDVVVMENIEHRKLAINEARTQHIIDIALSQLRKQIHDEMPEIINELNVLGSLDSMLNRHLYIDYFDEEKNKVKFLFIDPLC